MKPKKFTMEDIDACWPCHKEYLLQILNGDYPLDDARADLASLVGSKYDKRPKE